MNECFGKYYILNGKLMTNETFDNSLIYEGESVYEVLKCVGGLPVFFSDHMERFHRSVNVVNRPMLSETEAIRVDILKLTGVDGRAMINIKIVFNYNNGRSDALLYYLEPHYPTDRQYRSGVKGILFRAERKDPESKVIDMQLRSEINRKLEQENSYETLLVNRDNLITEGSRTNIFFVKDNRLYTAPEKMILSGITRKHILEICKENDVPVTFECVKADEIDQFDSVFITGTSPVVLPFSLIDDVRFSIDHPFLKLMMDQYQLKAELSMKQFSGK